MDKRQKNVSAIADYFASGCKKEQLIGLELEHFVVDKQSRRSLPYEKGAEQILKRLQPLYGEAVYSKGRIIGILREGSAITLEPAAQLEISIGPVVKNNLAKVSQIYNEFTSLLLPILAEMDCELVCAGYHPKSKIDELPMIPKQRYEYMASYLKDSGTHGLNMMKGSAATQVSIDYESEEDFLKKFRVANILGPILAFVCDNTSVFEGEPYRGRMLRTHIWNNVDPQRSMQVKNALDKGHFGFYDYAEYIYDVAPILMMKGEEAVYSGQKTVAELFADWDMSREDIEHVIGMVFPDVRLKTQLEIRNADSMPIELSLAYMSLISGLFYDDANLDMLYQKTRGLRNNDVAEAKSALMEKGAKAVVYDRPAEDWISELFQITIEALSEDEKKFFRPLAARRF